MPNKPQHPVQREKETRTATDEALEELKEQGHEEDTDTSDTSKGRGVGPGDPISPSPGANEHAVEDDRRK
ncbi:hypothetical protein [Streptomyces aurantiacus]|uniref:hypothetical protein n=1 Tax=Streptomyces aurantiacus TaxID=47760 RepID=UPI0006E3AFAA|nr:hypothetical protein [Streptomyces aurantiacus]